MNSDSLPLAGLRILDFSTVIMGPYASHLLADMGADVIKVEAPSGDNVRYYKPQRGSDMSGMFLNLHRNKRSIVLDMKAPETAPALEALVQCSDIVLHNFRPSVSRRLGLDYERLQQIRENVILCKLYGFGADGPNADLPAYDDVIQAASGLSQLFSRTQGKPAYVPSMITDKLVGQAAATAMLAAMHRRHVTGTGSEIEVPMYEVTVAFNLIENIAGAAFDPPQQEMGWLRNVSPMRKPFITANGYVCLLPYTEQNWRDFLSLAGREGMIEDTRYSTLAARAAHIDDLYKIVEEIAKSRTSEEWIDFCRAHSIPCAPVNRLDDLWKEPHLQAVQFFSEENHPTEGAYRAWRNPVSFSGVKFAINRHAPHLGENTEEILAELGLKTPNS